MHGFDGIGVTFTAQFLDKFQKAADPVAAHFGFPAVGIENAHAKIS